MLSNRPWTNKILLVSKFSFLKGALRGAAVTAISGIALTNGNYDVAVTLLKQKFGRPDSIIEMLYSKLQHLSTASQRFNRTYENIERVLRQLESQGENVNGQKILIHQILSKFPLDVILKLEDTKTFGQVWTMELLQKLLSQYVETQENAQRHFANVKGYVTGVRDGETCQGYQRYNRYLNDHNRDTKPSSVSVETFTTNVQRRSKFVYNPCVFCQGEHFNDECDQYRELSDRKQRLLSQGRCFLCLKTGHVFRDCSFVQKSGCYYCGKRRHHNRAICPLRFGNLAQPQPKSENVVVAPTQLDDNEAEKVEVLNSTSVQTQTLVSSGERVLLQTAIVPVQSSDKRKTILVKVLLDSASHHSFMTKKLAKQLQLTPQYKESLSVSTFAARKPQDVSTYVVEFNVITKDKCCMHFHANVIFSR